MDAKRDRQVQRRSVNVHNTEDLQIAEEAYKRNHVDVPTAPCYRRRTTLSFRQLSWPEVELHEFDSGPMYELSVETSSESER